LVIYHGVELVLLPLITLLLRAFVLPHITRRALCARAPAACRACTFLPRRAYLAWFTPRARLNLPSARLPTPLHHRPPFRAPTLPYRLLPTFATACLFA